MRLIAELALAAAVACTQAPPWQTQLEAIGIRFISARELKVMLDRREDLVLVDARDEVWYQAGHIPMDTFYTFQSAGQCGSRGSPSARIEGADGA